MRGRDFNGHPVVLAAIGTNVVMAFLVGRSAREMGIRISLGATEGAVTAHVVRQGMGIAAMGSMVDLAAALAVGRVRVGLLCGVGRSDPLSLVLALVTVLGCAFLATHVPACRAARADPVEALRRD